MCREDWKIVGEKLIDTNGKLIDTNGDIRGLVPDVVAGLDPHPL